MSWLARMRSVYIIWSPPDKAWWWLDYSGWGRHTSRTYLGAWFRAITNERMAKK